MHIEFIEKQDLKSHVKLFVEVFSNPPWSENWNFKTAHDRLLCYQNTPNFIGLSAMKNEEVIGFIFGNFEPYQDSFHFLLKEMCVKTSHQHQGIGKALISELHNILKRKEVKNVILLTQKNSPAEKFHVGNGYALVDSMGLYVKKV